jgi:hypothetical protein
MNRFIAVDMLIEEFFDSVVNARTCVYFAIGRPPGPRRRA